MSDPSLFLVDELEALSLDEAVASQAPGRHLVSYWRISGIILHLGALEIALVGLPRWRHVYYSAEGVVFSWTAPSSLRIRPCGMST